MEQFYVILYRVLWYSGAADCCVRKWCVIVCH